MTYYDVFNGDADGICALQQLRLAEPRDSVLVTGVKRDIGLLARVTAVAGDEVTVLDVSLDKNRAALDRVLAAGARVRYFDHHFPGEIPRHPNFHCHVETLPDKGTSLLVDDYLGGGIGPGRWWGPSGTTSTPRPGAPPSPWGSARRHWGSFATWGSTSTTTVTGPRWRTSISPPTPSTAGSRPTPIPSAFIVEDPAFTALRDGYEDDMARARAVQPALETAGHRLYVLPADPWGRRAGGVFANELAQESPSRAHALLTRLPTGGFVVSVRAPIERPDGADVLCRQFASGGGRKAAAGINDLPKADYDRFVAAFTAAF